jgi:hypothetical protein
MSRQRFEDQLRRQLRFLERSSAAYDGGFQDEAIRIATCIRVLIHDTSRSTSLLNHLAATGIRLLSTCMDIRRMLGGSDPFYAGARMQHFNGMALFGEGGYRTKLGNGPVHECLRVDDWWDQTVYVLDANNHLSRRDIVICAANRDGGAHVDERLTPDYELLITAGSLGVLVSQNQGERMGQPISNGHFLALRQMAYELLNSPELVALAAQA